MTPKQDKGPEVTILIVEDSPTQALQLQHLLEEAEYQVLVAQNGQEALGILKSQQPAIIISDILMPEMDGFELCKNIKQNENFRNIPVVLLTSLSDPHDVIRGLECGASNFITKPYEEKNLLKRLQHILINQELRKGQIAELVTEVYFAGKKYHISADRMQIIDLLFSTYENAIQKNRDLTKINKELTDTQQELKELNEQLEKKVAERTQKLADLNKVILAIRNVNQLIVKEKKPDRLIKQACKKLAETRHYYGTWIVLLDNSGTVQAAAESGFGEEFGLLFNQLKQGEFVPCFQEALKQSDPIIVADPLLTCTNCPYPQKHSHQAGMAVRLEHEGKVYGVLSVSSPPDVAQNKEEQSLFQEVAGDLAFALHSIKLDEDRKRAEELFSILAANSPVGVYIVQEGKFVYANPQFQQYSGYREDELLGMEALNLVFPEDRETVKNNAIQMLKGKCLVSYEFRIINKNGEIQWALESVASIQRQGKQAAIGSYQDISERKKAEQQMFSLQEQLRQSQKMEAIGRLAGGIAHDFNNLLTVITIQSELLLRELRENDPMRTKIKDINDAAERAANLTRQLLAFSRRQILDIKVLNLNTIINDLEKMLHRIIGENIELKALLADDLGMVKVDPGQMEQVIVNLAVNAKDAMPQGGKLSIETSNVELDETYSQNHIQAVPGAYVQLLISDTGIGMSKEVREQIFDPFFTTKEKGKGTGLGLSTVYGIVKQSMGTIWVYSEIDKGTTFKIYFPRVFEPGEELKKKETGEAVPRGTETILVVEDDGIVRELATVILKMQGYTVLKAEAGGEALLFSEQYKDPIHLILTDMVMPRMSGAQLIERIKQVRKNFKVLYMTGYAENAITQHGLLKKGVNLIQKPFTLEKLARKVREVLDEK